MSTKTIAVDTRVYERLAAVKRGGESFSRTIARLLEEVGEAHTGRDVLRGLEAAPPLSKGEAEQLLRVIEENRSDEAWDALDLR